MNLSLELNLNVQVQLQPQSKLLASAFFLLLLLTLTLTLAFTAAGESSKCLARRVLSLTNRLASGILHHVAAGDLLGNVVERAAFALLLLLALALMPASAPADACFSELTSFDMLAREHQDRDQDL